MRATRAIARDSSVRARFSDIVGILGFSHAGFIAARVSRARTIVDALVDSSARLTSRCTVSRPSSHPQDPVLPFRQSSVLRVVGQPEIKGAITLYKRGIAPIFHQLSPSIDKHTENLKKGDFAAIQQELGPQFAKVQDLVKKHGPEAIEKALNLAGKGGDKKAPSNGTKAE